MKARRSAEVLAAARRADWKRASALFATGADANAQGAHGVSSLMLAAKQGASQACCELLAARANLDARDEAGETAVAWACRSHVASASAVLQTLLEGRASVNGRNLSGRTVLMMAAEGTSEEALLLLLQARADVHAAAPPAGAQKAWAQGLVCNYIGDRVEQQEIGRNFIYNPTPELKPSSAFERETDGQPSVGLWEPLVHSKRGNINQYKHLFHAGGAKHGLGKNPTAVFFDRRLRTALGHYMQHRRTEDEMEERRREEEMDDAATDQELSEMASFMEQETSLDEAADGADEQEAELAELAEGEDEFDDGASARYSEIDILESLDMFISNVAPLRMQDLASPPLSAEEAAAVASQTAKLRSLRDRRAEEGDTALMVAARNGHASLCRILMDFGAEPGRLDCRGTCPLSAAAEGNHMSACQLMVGSVPSSVREAAIIAAERRGQEVAAAVLRGYQVLACP
ncbi:unnamed protein product [Polarella glacialis]|uniref:Uncharacterized protein n=1 Tax=Polarella glacialis TaxID=89957 RepID=A0A813FSU0_POLGL|nr:unnamed protein product [Polarella glacialis]